MAESRSSALKNRVVIKTSSSSTIVEKGLRVGRRWVLPGREALLASVLVLGAVGYNLAALWSERLPVHQINDGGVHISMIAWAAERFGSGDLPIDGWFPFLGLGLPQTHHYQSLPHIVSALPALLMGASAAYSWTLYLLLASWPISVYLGTRLMGWGRWESAFAAVIAPLVVSVPGLGFEFGSYTWRGSGVWSQLWGMWMLPLAWGFSWRAISGRGGYLWAAVTTALTIAFHFLTGYLALVCLGVMTVAGLKDFKLRLGRMAIVAGGTVLMAFWVIVPLLRESTWANQTMHADSIPGASYGAATILGWLVDGDLFDANRFPSVTLLLAAGAALCVWRFREDERARVLLGLGVLSLALFFGRPTLGSLTQLLPGGEDLIYRRFIMGVHLAGIMLAGVGAAAVASSLRDALRTGFQSLQRIDPRAVQLLAALLLTIGLGSAFGERWSFNSQGSAMIQAQRAADRGDGADFAELVEHAGQQEPGRIYAGTIWGDSWGDDYLIGRVPAYAALLNHGADAVGFMLRTQSLSADIEVQFDEANPAHYDLFNVRYLILPADREPSVSASLLRREGRHRLWQVATPGYLEVVDTVPNPIVADRTTMGEAMEGFLASSLPGRKQFPNVSFAGKPAPPPTAPAGTVLGGAAGSVESYLIDLSAGRAWASVYANREAVVMLKSSYHPRWSVEVDGEVIEPEMLAPSFVGARVPPGRHEVQFLYRPFPHYWSLLAAILAIAGTRYADRRRLLAVKTKNDSGLLEGRPIS